MHYYIVTGTSSGIGEAIARSLLSGQHRVFCISRRLNESLTDLASSIQGSLWYMEADLSDTGRIPRLMSDIFSIILTDDVTAIALINNAGMLEPQVPAGKYDLAGLQQHINLNLVAPMLLTSEFIAYTSTMYVPKSVINISSGAASSPYAGWGPYCSSKAGLDMFTRTTALEQRQNAYPVRILSVAPGIVDTPMQARVRATDEVDFPMKPRFQKLFEDNRLSQPRDVAQKIIPLIFGELPFDGELTDLRNL